MKTSKTQNGKLAIASHRIFLVSALLLSLGLWSGESLAQALGKDLSQVVITGKSAPVITAQKPIAQAIPDPLATLRSAKLIYIKSSSIMVGVSVIEEKLRERPEFQQMGLLITRDWEAADLILELEHDLFTMYVYTAIDPKTNVVVASGKLSSLGGTVAGKVAKRFLKQMLRARK